MVMVLTIYFKKENIMIPTQTDFPHEHPYVPEEERVHDRLKVKAKNEPAEIAGQGESNMPNGDMPTGDATDSVLGKK